MSDHTGDGELQFETVMLPPLPGSVTAPAGVSCVVCQAAIPDEYFDVNGQTVCGDCRTRVLSEAETAVAELLRGSAADVVLPDDVEAIADVIGRRFDESRSGKKPLPLNAEGTFSRERQTELLFREIERVTGPATDAGSRVAPGVA